MSLAHPLLLLAAPLLGCLLLLRRAPAGAALFSDTSILQSIAPSLRQKIRGPLLVLLLAVFLACLAVAAARPQQISVIEQPQEARNVLLSLDISRSMASADFRWGRQRISRLEGVKEVVSQVLAGRGQDRIGLVVFGASAYLQSPLTLDHGLIASLVGNLRVGVAGDGTAIGDGLGLAVKRSEEIAGKTKAIILITDGVNNSGSVDPMKAARVARDLGIKVHTIGIGSDQPVSQGLGGGLLGMHIPAQVEFDEKLLRAISAETGGVYWNAGSVERLQEIYQEIDRLDTLTLEEPERQNIEELYPQWVGFALSALTVLLILHHTIFMKVP